MADRTREQTDFDRVMLLALADRGELIKAGWEAFAKTVMPQDAPEQQIADMRGCFFVGAQHIFAAIVTIVPNHDEPELADLERFTRIHNELQEFLANELLPRLEATRKAREQ